MVENIQEAHDLDFPEMPVVESLDTCPVLAAYGQTMECAQYFETTLKAIMMLARFYERVEEGRLRDPLFVKGEDPDRQTMGQALRVLRDHLIKKGLALPDEMFEALLALVDMRNLFAHRYLVEKHRFMRSPEGRKLMIIELREFSGRFIMTRQVFDHLLKKLIAGLPVEEEMIAFLNDGIWGKGRDVSPEELREYREEVEGLTTPSQQGTVGA